MQQFQPKRLYQEIGLKLREELANGTYKVGDRLPPERDIAERLGVSRTVVREALIMLEIEQLVDVRKGSGVYVINLPGQGPAQDETSHRMQGDVGPFELLQARQLLESNIAGFAAMQVTKTEIARMKKALELEKQALEGGSSNEDGDEMFHMLIAEATQNSVLVDAVRRLWQCRHNSEMWRQLHSRILDQSYRGKWLDDHYAILAALQRRDSEGARQAVWKHLENVKQTLMELSDVDDPNFDGYLFGSDPVIRTG